MHLSTQKSNKNKGKSRITLKELCLFAMLGALMFASKMVMEILPNIHLIGMFTMVFTVVFRKKALIPLYVYVFLDGLFHTFNTWWVPYLYIWTVLWGITMLLPKNMPKKVARIVYPAVCCLHGLAFGTLYAPVQAILFGLNFKQTLMWIVTGLPADILHAVSNLFLGALVLPLSELFKKAVRQR